MERPWIAGWELTTNEKGVEMATLPAQMLRDTLDYLERLEKQCNIPNVVGQSEELPDFYCGNYELGINKCDDQCVGCADTV